MTEEELLRCEEKRKERAKQHSKKSYKKKAKHMREVYDRERAEDIEAFRLKKRTQAASWVARNKPKARAADSRTREKALAERRFACKPCNKAFTDSYRLARHEKTDRHKDKLNGRRPSRRTLQSRADSARAKAEKRFFCSACNQTFDGQYHLDAHNLTAKHLKNQRLIDTKDAAVDGSS